MEVGKSLLLNPVINIRLHGALKSVWAAATAPLPNAIVLERYQVPALTERRSAGLR